jgi:hypothetical protein
MRFAKGLGFGILLALLVWGLGGRLKAQQEIDGETGEIVKDSGCVKQGVEGGCLILKTFDEKNVYTLLFSDGEMPELGAAISFEGSKHGGPTTCMQGTAVDVKKWVRINRRCPSEPAPK